MSARATFDAPDQSPTTSASGDLNTDRNTYSGTTKNNNNSNGNSIDGKSVDGKSVDGRNNNFKSATSNGGSNTGGGGRGNTGGGGNSGDSSLNAQARLLATQDTRFESARAEFDTVNDSAALDLVGETSLDVDSAAANAADAPLQLAVGAISGGPTGSDVAVFQGRGGAVYEGVPTAEVVVGVVSDDEADDEMASCSSGMSHGDDDEYADPQARFVYSPYSPM